MRTELTPQSAANLLLERYRARANIDDWCRHCGFEPARHHLHLTSRLQRVVTGKCKRLAVFMPPGSAKSTYGSVLFPPYAMAAVPGSSLIAASHTVELAEKWGRRVRGLVNEHGHTLKIGLSNESQAAGRWALTDGGEYYAAGVTTGIAGFRADGAIIDDPIRTREDADSKLIRDRIWEWYKSDLRTRLRPNGWIVLIQTRWHEDDLAGRILEEMAAGGEQWEIVSLPAEAGPNDPLGREEGEWLWDTEYGYADALRLEKKTQPARNWSSLYQQNPTPDTGLFFLADWIRPYIDPPDRKTLQVYGASDYAVTDDDGDYTVHIVVGLDPEDKMFVLDMWRGRTSSDVWVDTLCDMILHWKPLGWAEESGQIRAGVGPFLSKRMEERKAYVARAQFPTRGDKRVRAQSIRGRMAMKGLYVPMHAPWYADLRAELLSFDAGKHDDIVDSLGLIGQIIDKMVPGRAPVAARPRPVLGVGIGQSTATMNDLWAQRDIKGRRAASGRIK